MKGASGSIIWMVFGLPGYRSGLTREEFANNANNKICFLSLAEVLVVSPNPRGRTPPPLQPLFSNMARKNGKTAIIVEPLPACKSIHPVLWKEKTSVMKIKRFFPGEEGDD